MSYTNHFKPINKIKLVMKQMLLKIKAVHQLGLKPSILYSAYQLGLACGYYDLPMVWRNKATGIDDHTYQIDRIIDLPEKKSVIDCLSQHGIEQLCVEADEIVNGKVRLFGGDAVDLVLIPPSPLAYWTAYETGRAVIDGDIKSVWEPGRFGWAYTLARAYHLTGDEKYAQAFWQLTEAFLQANLPYDGPQWMSVQEVALRLISLTFAWQVFSNSNATNATRATALGKSIADHANRIPPTLMYARAQNNNHLISESTGLITAGLALPQHPKAKRWLKLGWHWLNRSLAEQIDQDGGYIQHSANYHRLMLQLALWVNCLAEHQHKMERSGFEVPGNFEISSDNKKRLKFATHWLLGLVDEQSGQVPNLGANDGAYIQPLCVNPFNDYRPVLQASSAVFGGKPAFGEGSWDEMRLWYGGVIKTAEQDQGGVRNKKTTRLKDGAPHVIQNSASRSWAYLRIAVYNDRPSHADQLHLELWRQGLNIAQDAGSYKYNDPPPWDNALAKTAVHNTVTVNGLDQMTHAGKFLWLDWAQARIVNAERTDRNGSACITAEHNGFRKIGILHRRSVSAQDDGSWLIEDRMLPLQSALNFNKKYSFRIHWLLCDAPWELDHGILTLTTQQGKITVQIHSENPEVNFQLVRAGELLAGEGTVSPTWGWVSPTYSYKKPAISFSATYRAKPPILITTRINF